MRAVDFFLGAPFYFFKIIGYEKPVERGFLVDGLVVSGEAQSLGTGRDLPQTGHSLNSSARVADIGSQQGKRQVNSITSESRRTLSATNSVLGRLAASYSSGKSSSG